MLVADAVGQQSTPTEDIDRNIPRTAVGAHKAATSIVELKCAAAMLNSQSKDLAGDVQRFIKSARAI